MTTGWDDPSFEKVDVRTFAQTNLVRDVLVLVARLDIITSNAL